jgi:competence protein ComEC
MRLPSPLPCAIGLAAAIALTGRDAPTSPVGAVADDREAERIVGTIGAPVERAASGFGAPLETAETTVWVWSERELLPGQRVAVTGRLRMPRGLRDPGVADRAGQLASRGADWELTATQVEVLTDEPGLRDELWRWARATQRSWARAIDEEGATDRDGAAALRGIVTGDRGDVPDELDQRWRSLGIYHVLSVSGLHLAVVAGLLFALLRRVVAASPWGGRVHAARWAAPPALAAAIAYTMITGAQLATVRALVVVAIAFIARAFDRPLRLIDALGFAALVLLAWRPADLRDPSFQLSFVAALTLALRPAVARRPGVLGWLARGVATSAWIAITTAPLTAYHFHQVAAGGVVGNLVLTPALELGALPLALAGLACGAIVPAAGAGLLAAAVWLVARVDDVAGMLAGAVPVGTVAVASPAVLAMLVALSLWLAARARRTLVDALAWIALCGLWASARTPPPPGALRVTFLDVGQGTATLVELPDGAVWLVDAGGLASAPDVAHAAAPGRAIAATLATRDHDAIDLAVISHPHPDHYLGLAALRVPVGELWSADDSALTPAPVPRGRGLVSFADVARALAAGGTRLAHPRLGLARAEAGVELVIWGPSYQPAPDAVEIAMADPVRSVNDNSLVVAIRYAGRTILLPGDVEAEGEEALVAAALPHIDVVAVPHHGSPTSSTPAFVAATHPALAVISCGVANHFGFPSAAVVARWKDAGATVERTDRSGAVTVTISRNGELSVETLDP